MPADDYAHPHEVNDLQLAFPANLGTLLPPMHLIPTDYPRKHEWHNFQHHWFTNGLPPHCEFHAADGIDARNAYRHLAAINGSYEPKHEHKEAAVAWLASRWLRDIPGPPQ